MEIRPESVQNSTGDPPRHGPERGRGLTALTTDSALVFSSKPTHKMFYLYLGVALFLCLPNSIYCVPDYHEQTRNSVDLNEGRFQNKYEQYYDGDANIEGENTVQHQTSFTDKLREQFLTSKHEKVRGKPLTFKAEISFGLLDVRDFLRGLVKVSSTAAHQQTQDTHQRRSARDTEPQMSAESDGPWTSNLSQAAVVGSIVGGTLAVFMIVVLTVIFCSYKNYSSLEMRQRTADVYGGSGHPQAERRR